LRGVPCGRARAVLQRRTARLGTDIGGQPRARHRAGLGIERELQPTRRAAGRGGPPRWKSRRCQTIASGGFRAPCAPSVKSPPGETPEALPPRGRAGLSARAHLPHHRRHAGRGARGTGGPCDLAAPSRGRRQDRKTDEQRDAWFAGFTGDKLAIVWIGYDDNAGAVTGPAPALPVWGELMAASPELWRSQARHRDRRRSASAARRRGLRRRLELPFARARAHRARPVRERGRHRRRDVKQTTKNWLQRLWEGKVSS